MSNVLSKLVSLCTLNTPQGNINGFDDGVTRWRRWLLCWWGLYRCRWWGLCWWGLFRCRSFRRFTHWRRRTRWRSRPCVSRSKRFHQAWDGNLGKNRICQAPCVARVPPHPKQKNTDICIYMYIFNKQKHNNNIYIYIYMYITRGWQNVSVPSHPPKLLLHTGSSSLRGGGVLCIGSSLRGGGVRCTGSSLRVFGGFIHPCALRAWRVANLWRAWLHPPLQPSAKVDLFLSFFWRHPTYNPT